jgi:hypothetical protein
LGGFYIFFYAESDYDSPGAWREILFFIVGPPFLQFFLLLLLVTGRTTQGMSLELGHELMANGCWGSDIQQAIAHPRATAHPHPLASAAAKVERVCVCMCMCMCEWACVRACVRACVLERLHIRIRSPRRLRRLSVCVCVCVCVCVSGRACVERVFVSCTVVGMRTHTCEQA